MRIPKLKQLLLGAALFGAGTGAAAAADAPPVRVTA